MSVESKSADYWRGKYRALLREQELASDPSSQAPQQALALMAELACHLDVELAQSLKVVEQQAKRGQWGKPGQLELLKDAAKAYRRQRDLSLERESQAVDQVVKALSAFTLTKASQAQLKALPKLQRKQQYSSDWIGLMEALTLLQPKSAAAGEETQGGGLLRRLLGSGSAKSSDGSSVASTDKPIAKAAVASTESPKVAAPTSPHAAPSSHADSDYDQVNEQLCAVLGDLLAQIEPEQAVVEKALSARQRIDRGLNWFDLIPTLEEIRDLVMALVINAKQDYEHYLLHLLEQINQLIQMAADVSENFSSQERELLQQFDTDLGAIGRALQSVEDISELKQVIDGRVQSLAQIIQARREKPRADSDFNDQVKQMQATIETMRQEAQQRQQELEINRIKARTDALTGIANRDAYNERIHQEMERFQRYQRPLSLVVCDIDHFKKFNDQYSHLVGDKVLKVLSNAIVKQLREVDFIARYGGEEFVIIMPETDGENALQKMDKIRAAVSATRFKYKEQELKVTFSSGVAQAMAEEGINQLFERADKALYRAKDAGRNRSELAPHAVIG